MLMSDQIYDLKELRTPEQRIIANNKNPEIIDKILFNEHEWLVFKDLNTPEGYFSKRNKYGDVEHYPIEK